MRKIAWVAAFAAMVMVTVSASAQSATPRIVKAADAFLATLTDAQRKSVMFSFDDDKQRARWSNFPTGFIPRGGIDLKEMNAQQRSAAMALMATVLSKKGYQKIEEIMEGDEVLKIDEAKHPTGPGGPGGPGGSGGPPNGQDHGGQDHNGPPPGGQAGGPPPGNGPGDGHGPPHLSGDMFGKDLYYISFLGKPSETSPWMLQFGGHHLALNITIAGARGLLTPTLTGAQPAMYTIKGKTVRPLGAESDKGLALLNALDTDQKKQAVLSYQLADLVLGPGMDGKTIVPEGLKASSMTDKQKAMLLDVISEWAGIVHESEAAVRMAELKADLNETWFMWSGPVTAESGKNIKAYYRIQGPHVVIEYSPQTLGGDPSLHVHAMYRDPTNDYGRGLLKQ